MLTFFDVKADRGIQRIASYAPDSDDYASVVEAACRRLLRRGDWAGTLVPIFACIRSGCVVWNRYVQTVRALSWCGRGVVPENIWGSYLPRGKQEPWRHGLRWFTGRDCQSALIANGRTSVFQDILGEGRLLRAYARTNKDYGKTLTFFGTDNNGQALRHQDLTGAWVPGLVLTLGSPYATDSTAVRSIEYVLKDVTQLPVNVFAYNPTTDLLEPIAQYDPGETRPDYQRTKVSLPWAGTGACNTAPTTTSCCDAPRGVAALVKLRFIAPRYDTDLVIPDNLDAIKLAVQSVKFGEAGDRGNAKAFEADAITELNRQLEDESPDDQFVADDYVFAGQTFTNHCF